MKQWSWFGQWLPQSEAQHAREHCVALIGAFLSFFLWRSVYWPPFSLSPLTPSKPCLSLFIHKFSTSCVLSHSHFHKISLDFVSLILSQLMHVLHFFSLSLSDLSVGEWQQDSSSGNTSRVLSYTIALNNPLGPKTAPVVETQVSSWKNSRRF